MAAKYNTIAVIGGGVMGIVLVRSLKEAKLARRIVVCEKNRDRYADLRKIGSLVHPTEDLAECRDADVVFLAVKPQDFGSVALKLKKSVLVCSIMAGVSIGAIRKQLGVKKIARFMPNTPARVSKGFTAWTVTKEVGAPEKKFVINFLDSIGEHMYVKDEDGIDKATAVTGSGPGYLFNELAMFTAAAARLGFKPEEARRMVRQVLRGVSALSETSDDFEGMARQVTSKGGTTEAALEVFEKARSGAIWKKAVSAAYKRAKKLSRAK